MLLAHICSLFTAVLELAVGAGAGARAERHYNSPSGLYQIRDAHVSMLCARLMNGQWVK